MSDFFPHDPTTLNVVDVEALLPDAKRPDCTTRSREYSKAATALRKAGRALDADTLRLLSVVTGFYPTFAERPRPYRAMLIMDRRISPIPDDLSSEELTAIRVIAGKVTSPTLKARLFDVLWVCDKKHNDAKEATENYLGRV